MQSDTTVIPDICTDIYKNIGMLKDILYYSGFIGFVLCALH